MSAKQYYLVKRKDRLTKGKPTYYCRFRDESGALLPWKSTGETSKTRAENWAIGQIKQGEILTRLNLTFGRYAAKWWTKDCEYTRRKRARGKSISPGYADAMRTYLDRHILPYFKNKLLNRITPADIEHWLLSLRDKKTRDGYLSPTTVNHCLTNLKIMLKEAARLGLLSSSPAAFIERLKEKPKVKTILSLEEVRALFRESSIEKIWGGDMKHFTLNLLAASTGLRMGEVQGLQVRHVHPDYIEVVQSWARKHGMKNPKWNSQREIPIASRTSKYIYSLIHYSPFQEPEDFVFWGADRQSPIAHDVILKMLYRAFENIGITPEQRKARNITFHGWRHLFNSVCRGRIPDYKLQRLTGHRTIEMTERYTHVNLDDFREVMEIQGELLS
jgi:integrase